MSEMEVVQREEEDEVDTKVVYDRNEESVTHKTSFEDLSEELQFEILQSMDPLDLVKVSLVCKTWYRLSNDQMVWHHLCIETCKEYELGFNMTQPIPPARWKSWKEAWIWFYRSKNKIFDSDEVKQGLGAFEWSNGARYEGEWNDDKEHGFGTKKWKDGATFEGEWKNGQFDGFGFHTWASGSMYRGGWKDHKRWGWGVNVWPHKDRYEGSWKDDQKNGFGIYFWADGRVYQGNWKEDKRSGMGTFMWPKSGYGYSGEWLDDRRHGIGKFMWNDGDYYEGEWVQGKRKGPGVFHCRNGCLLPQEWEENEFDASKKGIESMQRCFQASLESIQDIAIKRKAQYGAVSQLVVKEKRRKVSND